MRIARVKGRVTLSPKVDELKPGSLLICEAMDAAGLDDVEGFTRRESDMAESLVVFDHFGAGEGDLIAFTEGGEATQPFRPERVPVDAYCAAIVDRISISEG